jgi:transposase
MEMAAGDLTDHDWAPVEEVLVGARGSPGRPNLAARRALNGILWRARNGACWRAVPERYGKWNTVWRRFARWRDAGLFELLFEAFARCGAADERVQMLDGTVVRAHQHAAGGVHGCEAEALGRSRGGFSTKIHLRCDGRGLPLAIVLTPGQRHEARAFGDLVEGLARSTRCVIGDVGYDADAIQEALLLRGILPVIPPNPVRRERVALDRDFYRFRNKIERLVNRLKQFRSVATRYDKTAPSFLSFVHIAAVCIWLRFVHAA